MHVASYALLLRAVVHVASYALLLRAAVHVAAYALLLRAAVHVAAYALLLRAAVHVASYALLLKAVVHELQDYDNCHRASISFYGLPTHFIELYIVIYSINHEAIKLLILWAQKCKETTIYSQLRFVYDSALHVCSVLSIV